MKFEENLRELRKQHGLSQEELADKLGVSRQAVSKWENGSGYPELDKLMALCDLFRCTMDDLLKGDVREKNTVSIQIYEDHYNTMSKSTALGVFVIMMALVSGAFLEPYLSKEKEAAIGIIFFIIIAVGVLIFIYYGMQSDAYKKKYPKTPCDIYTREEIDAFERKYRISLLVSVGIILLSFAVQQLLEVIGREKFANGIWMLMITIAVVILVYYGMLKSKIDETLPKSEDMLKKQRAEARVGRWCGCIMIIATAIFLLWSFMFDAWKISWIAFAIGGLCCAISSIVLKKEDAE